MGKAERRRKIHLRRPCMSSPDSPFSLKSHIALSNHLDCGLPHLLIHCTSIPIDILRNVRARVHARANVCVSACVRECVRACACAYACVWIQTMLPYWSNLPYSHIFQNEAYTTNKYVRVTGHLSMDIAILVDCSATLRVVPTHSFPYLETCKCRAF